MAPVKLIVPLTNYCAVHCHFPCIKAQSRVPHRPMHEKRMTFKDAWSDFLEWKFFIQMMHHAPKYLQISFKSVKPLGHNKRLRILQMPIPYCVRLIMVTITSRIFNNIFQTVHFSAVKFTRGNEKNMSFLLIPKSEKV